jgi:hypothetical protein
MQLSPSPAGLDAISAAIHSAFNTPIFITSYNHLTYLKKQIAWLTSAGYTNIYIIDNNSSYEPLLAYYDSVIPKIKVIQLDQNAGPYAFWRADLISKLNIQGPFVVTDNDIVPDEDCPKDLVRHLLTVLHAYPSIYKVGVGLHIDDLPDSYRYKEQVKIWESQFWRRPVARGLFLANIDSTLAVYRPRCEFALEPAIRTGWPYLARHEPWYADSANLGEDDRYYAASAIHTNWGAETLAMALDEKVERLRRKPKTLLRLGCSREIFPGWINLDFQCTTGVDISFSPDAFATQELSLDNDSIDGFFMSHAFEHVEHTMEMMVELYRVAKPGAKFIIRLPYGKSNKAHQVPIQRHIYFPESFDCFSQPSHSRADTDYRGDWEVKRVSLVVNSNLLQSEGPERVLVRAKTQQNIVQEMLVELTAIKPARPRDVSLLKAAAISLTGSSLDMDSYF